MGLFDGYKRGAEAAKLDAGENKLASRSIKEFAKNGLGLIPGAKNREDEFRKGYVETNQQIIRDAQRDVPIHESNELSHVGKGAASRSTKTQQGKQTMASNRSVDEQIEMLKEMGRYIWALKGALEEASINYEREIKGMEGRGMDATVGRFYDVHVIPLLNHLKLAEDGLSDEALPSLKKIIDHLEALPRV